MTDTAEQPLLPAERRRMAVWGLIRAALSATVVIALYFLLPLDGTEKIPLGVTLVVALVVLLGVSSWQLNAILRSESPGLRAIEALAITVPLYILLFASTYFVMENTDPASFSPSGMTRIDALYLTVTTFATVGFGDITATSQTARLIITAQMILNLLVLGVGIRVFIGAVQRSRKSKSPEAGSPR